MDGEEEDVGDEHNEGDGGGVLSQLIALFDSSPCKSAGDDGGRGGCAFSQRTWFFAIKGPK